MFKIISILALISVSIFADYDKSRIFIELKDGASVPNSKFIKSSKHLFKNYYVLRTNDLLKLEKQLKADKSIVKTQRNYKSQVKVLPKPTAVLPTHNKSLMNFDSPFNDPKVSRIWAFRDADENGVSVNKHYLAPLAVDKKINIVAVVDTGVDYNHEDLKDVMWINKFETPGNGIDDDNNGYIDDVYGISTLDRDSNGQASGDPMASHAHGTHVSGTIAATQNNNTGIAGISSAARIMAIRTVPDASDETDADIVESFLYAAKHGAKLINCSFGKRVNEGGNIVNETITHIGKEYGVLTLAAAGNESSNNDRNAKYPASFDSDYLLVIASTNSRGRMSYFSNYGEKTVDLAAPGSGIYSTVPGNDYDSMSGTSMATPVSVGVASEVLANFPKLSPLQLKSILMKSSTKVDRFEGKIVSGGRIDLANAIQYTLENYIFLK